MLHQKNKEALQDKQLKDKNRAVAKRENEREMLRKKQQNMQVNSYEPETEMVEAVSPADANKEKMLQKKQLMLNRQKLQLQTKAVNSGQKTDMSLRKEEQMKGNKDVSINPKVGGTCPKDGGMIIDGVCQECGGKAKNESFIMERPLSKGEEKEKEKNVKGMKKSFSDFKKRYGKDAKSVMYATATKMAKEDVELDERTRYAKETGKDFKTGNPSEKGGKEPAPAMKSVKDYMRKTGGAISSRGKAIALRGKKKDKGAKPKFKSEPTPVDKIRGKLAKKRAPKPDIGSRFD
jgi:hypothetical protein